jgi:signal transduction histidine kinase
MLARVDGRPEGQAPGGGKAGGAGGPADRGASVPAPVAPAPAAPGPQAPPAAPVTPADRGASVPAPVAPAPAAPGPEAPPAVPARPPRAPASLSRRLFKVAVIWTTLLLAVGGLALNAALTGFLRRNFDAELEATLTAMIASAEVGPEREARFTRALADQRFFEPYSGHYWQVLAPGQAPFRSRSLWDRRLGPGLPEPALEPRIYTWAEGAFAAEPVRVMERDAVLPGSPTVFRFQIGRSTRALDAELARMRAILAWSLGALGLGLLSMAWLQARVGLKPLRGVRQAIAAIRSGDAARVPDDFPPEVRPLVTELNALLEHAEAQAEEARRHAGNLAHALKTPMSVLLNEARAGAPDLARTVEAQLQVMGRHVDHHLARARAVGRRSASTARAEVWPALMGVARTVERIHTDRGVVIDIAGEKEAVFRGERQDLEEMLGNLLDNAAKYGGGRAFVTVSLEKGAARDGGDLVAIAIEDEGPGIPPAEREAIFGRGARLDTSKPGTGLGLAITRDVAEIYGGSVTLGESEDLGGLLVTLRLPAAG